VAVNDAYHPPERATTPYVLDGKSWQLGRLRHPSAGLGNLYASRDDMIAWLNVLRAGGLPNVDLSPLWGETMIAAQRPCQYGLGMMLRRYRGIVLRGHVGRWPGYRSAMFHAPELDMGFLVTANRSDFNTEDVLFGLIDLFAANAMGQPTLVQSTAMNMEKAGVQEANMPRLNGVYQHNNHFLKLHWTPPYLTAQTANFNMQTVCTPHGFFTSRFGFMPLHIKPGADPKSGQIALDVILGGVRERFTRTEMTESKAAWPDYYGEYLYEAFDTKMNVFEDNGMLKFRLGGLANVGSAFTLQPLGSDMFEAKDPTPDSPASYIVKFDREPTSRMVRQLIFTNDRLPQLLFRKLRSF
jgi:hypothetical protein